MHILHREFSAASRLCFPLAVSVAMLFAASSCGSSDATTSPTPSAPFTQNDVTVGTGATANAGNTVRVSYTNDRGAPVVRYVHLVQRFGQAGEPLAELQLPPAGRRLVKFELVYPPDATPPQVLTVKTLSVKTMNAEPVTVSP